MTACANLEGVCYLFSVSGWGQKRGRLAEVAEATTRSTFADRLAELPRARSARPRKSAEAARRDPYSTPRLGRSSTSTPRPGGREGLRVRSTQLELSEGPRHVRELQENGRTPCWDPGCRGSMYDQCMRRTGAPRGAPEANLLFGRARANWQKLATSVAESVAGADRQKLPTWREPTPSPTFSVTPSRQRADKWTKLASARMLDRAAQLDRRRLRPRRLHRRDRAPRPLPAVRRHSIDVDVRYQKK
jgi:hypothetical protein